MNIIKLGFHSVEAGNRDIIVAALPQYQSRISRRTTPAGCQLLETLHQRRNKQIRLFLMEKRVQVIRHQDITKAIHRELVSIPFKELQDFAACPLVGEHFAAGPRDCRYEMDATGKSKALVALTHFGLPNIPGRSGDLPR